MGVAWLVGAVARVFQLGCKLDTMVVLVGPQGVGKSSGCAALMPDGGWFSDSALDLRNKDAFLQLRGVWLYELAELRGMNGTSPEVIKAFLSSRCDRFRAPYARHTESRARQCFFVGTTNDRNFLRDQTGARRFWPVLVGRVDGVGLQQVRDQLWAEARVRYEAGARWWLSEGQEAELGALAADYAVMDPCEERILVWVREQGEPFTVRQVLEMLGVPLERQDRRCSRRVGALLAQLGCEQGRPSGVGARPRVWWWPKEAV
jgi:predicted P-loop ATPase